VLHLAQDELSRTFATDHDEVDPVGDEVGPQPEALTAEAFDAITDNCIADLAGHHDPETRRRARQALRDEQHEMPARRAQPFGLNTKEVGPTSEPALLCEFHRKIGSTEDQISK
jgi:hypothetical protein